MKRLLLTLMTILPLAVGATVAHADGPGGGYGQGAWTGGGGTPPPPVAAVAGTVVTVDSDGSFLANAYLLSKRPDRRHGPGVGDGPGRYGGGFGSGADRRIGSFWTNDTATSTPPAATQVTITTNSNTKVFLNGRESAVSDFSTGDKFVALFNSPSSTTDLQTLVSGNPALAVFAHTPPQPHQLYAFVGTVTAVDETKDNLTVTVTRTLPSDLAAANSPATFTVSSDTLVLGGSASGGLFGGGLSDVSVGDIVAGGLIGVAGGLIGVAGETLAQVEATPLRVLLDLPVSSTSTTTASQAMNAKRKALTQALSLLGVKSSSSKSSSRHTSSRHRKAKPGKAAHTRKHAGKK